MHEQRLWSAVEGYRALLTQTEVRLRRSHEILASTNAVLHQSRLVNTRIRMDEMNDRDSSGGRLQTTTNWLRSVDSGPQIAA